jgi:TnpA family transposase
VLTKPIDWEIVSQRYDQMIKYVTAVRLGTAETEAILRRFTRNNVQYPAYKWNGANDFVFFARRGEMTSNRREDHEISMLALHLLQNCMVYVNTLMVQQVLAQPHWEKRLTTRDLGALTPLIWDHVNPYGRFDLDMEARLPID